MNFHAAIFVLLIAGYLKMITSFMLRLATLAFLVSSVSAQPLDSALAVKLQGTLDSMRIVHGIKGVSASVFHPELGKWSGVSGVSHGTTPITPTMQFGIASNTKLFTAVAILKLRENGRLSLEGSLRTWLPTYANIDPSITIRQLLNHVSGVEDITNFPGYADSILGNPNRVFTPNELMAWVGPPLFPAGTSWSYSNTNYILAGMIAERAAGQRFGRFLRDSVLTPLRLDSTFLDVEEVVQGVKAHPWQNGVDIDSIQRTSLNSAAWSAGGMYSTSGQMSQWYNSLMSRRFLNPVSFREMTTFVGSGNYGFGISQQIIAGRTCWGHSGSIRGYRSQMLYDTASSAVVCVLVNSNPSPVNIVARQLLLTLVNKVATEVGDKAAQTPQTYALEQNFPNPFNPSTTIRFKVRSSGFTSLQVFDLLGRKIATLVNQKIEAGAHEVTFDGTSVPSGVYFYRMIATSSRGSFQQTRKFILLR